MNVSIIAVGTELLFGQTINTNAAYLSNRINLMGFNVMYHFVVGDNPSRLKNILHTALAETDIVVLTGGLGPTQDDLTKETVAQQFGCKLIKNEECYREMAEYFGNSGKKMTENNIKQSYIPEGATVFHNDAGTAPGFALKKNGKCAICLPGPPREMKNMFVKWCADYLKNFNERRMYYKVIRTIGIGESSLETILLPLIDNQVDPTIATYAKEGECTLRVASQRDTEEEAVSAVNNTIKQVNELIGDYIYSYEGEELKTVVVNKLISRNISLSAAESCTGGLFAANITDVQGASAIFDRSLVTYSLDSKIDELGVKKEILDKYTAVSEETAMEMVKGLEKISGSEICVTITGYAGPGTIEEPEKGIAYVGYYHDGRYGVKKFETHRNDRIWNRNYFVLNMLSLINNILEGKID